SRFPGPRVEPAHPPVSHPAFWDGLYAGGQDGWDLGEASPALVDWLGAGGRLRAAAGGASGGAAGRCGGGAGGPVGRSADWGCAGAISGPRQMKGLEEVDGRQPTPRNAAAPARV